MRVDKYGRSSRDWNYNPFDEGKTKCYNCNNRDFLANMNDISDEDGKIRLNKFLCNSCRTMIWFNEDGVENSKVIYRDGKFFVK